MQWKEEMQNGYLGSAPWHKHTLQFGEEGFAAISDCATGNFLRITCGDLRTQMRVPSVAKGKTFVDAMVKALAELEAGE